MAEPLIPDDVRAMYEALIEEGSRLLPPEASEQDREIAEALSEAGLVIVTAHTPPLLSPTSPDAAFARLLPRWHAAIGQTRDRLTAAASAAIRCERAAVRTKSRGARGPCSLIAAYDHVSALQYALEFSAERVCRSWETGPYGVPRTLPTGAPHPIEPHYFAPRLSERGVQHVVMYDVPFLEGAKGLEDMAAGYVDGEEIRLLQEKLPMKLLIVDDDTALVPLGPYGYPCLLVRDEALVSVFVRFFELKWAQATPWAPPGTSIQEKENTQRRHILDALAAGVKDEAIARQQGVSVRTVRRHIAALMDELGVTTRFAAGVAAVRRGWLSSAA